MPGFIYIVRYLASLSLCTHSDHGNIQLPFDDFDEFNLNFTSHSSSVLASH